jgi:phosphatidylglycerol:prolipoprotein diacylglycerol transferase
VPWAVVFPGEAAQTCPADWVGPCARHPSQLYEAGLEGVALFLLLAFAVQRGALATPGRVMALFLMGYGLARVFVEAFRQADQHYVSPDNPVGHVLRLGAEAGLTMGQVLSLPMLLAGAVLLVWSGRRT